MASLDPDVAQGAAALALGDWSGARRHFEASLEAMGETPAALEGLSEALFWLDEIGPSIERRTRAYTIFQESGDASRAARAALWLAMMLHCKPGKVRQMVDRFRVISAALKDMGHEPPRLLTDVTGERFWTIVLEVNVGKIEDYFAMEQALMANATLRSTIADYHDLIEDGRREIYRIES